MQQHNVLVITCGSEYFAIGRETQATDFPIRYLCVKKKPTGFHVREGDNAALISAGNGPSIGRKGQQIDLGTMRVNHVPCLATVNIPNANRAVTASRGQGATVRAKGYASRCVLMAPQQMQAFSGRGIIQHGVVF